MLLFCKNVAKSKVHFRRTTLSGYTSSYRMVHITTKLDSTSISKGHVGPPQNVISLSILIHNVGFDDNKYNHVLRLEQYEVLKHDQSKTNWMSMELDYLIEV